VAGFDDCLDNYR
jgi:hypothetical protein